MKRLLVVLAFVLSACSTTPEVPTPFETGEAVQAPIGCQMLRKEVEDYNKQHPTTPKTVDC